MTREEYIFTIGFDGDGAVVDKNSSKQYGKFSTAELLDKGFIKAAICSAIFSAKEEEFKLVLDRYNAIANVKVESFDILKKIFGVTA